MQTIYIKLLNEDTTAYRPVEAKSLSGNIFRIPSDAKHDLEDEEWEFLPGSTVVCEIHRLSGEERLVATSNTPQPIV